MDKYLKEMILRCAMKDIRDSSTSPEIIEAKRNLYRLILSKGMYLNDMKEIAKKIGFEPLWDHQKNNDEWFVNEIIRITMEK